MTLPDPRSPETSGLAGKTAEVPSRRHWPGRIARRQDSARPICVAWVTINESMQILHFHGQTSLYLEPPSGEASLNLLRVAHQSLLFSLRKAIDTAADQKKRYTNRRAL